MRRTHDQWVRQANEQGLVIAFGSGDHLHEFCLWLNENSVAEFVTMSSNKGEGSDRVISVYRLCDPDEKVEKVRIDFRKDGP